MVDKFTKVAPAPSGLLVADFIELLDIDFGSFDCRPSMPVVDTGASLAVCALAGADVVDVVLRDFGGDVVEALVNSFCCRSLVIADRTF